jgi:hypothetical protein
MIEFKKKIRIWDSLESKIKTAKHYKVGDKIYDTNRIRWEVGEDINFDKFWFREIEDKEPELEVKGFRKDD